MVSTNSKQVLANCRRLDADMMLLPFASPFLNSTVVSREKESSKYALNLAQGWSQGLIAKSIITMTFVSWPQCLLTQQIRKYVSSFFVRCLYFT